MVESLRPSRLAGRKFRLTWTAGPTVSVTHEHVFHTDGTVSYAQVEHDKAPAHYTTAKQYGAFELAEDIFLVSYLGTTGYSLSVAMNFKDKRLHGFAADATRWYPVQGRFEELPK